MAVHLGRGAAVSGLNYLESINDAIQVGSVTFLRVSYPCGVAGLCV